jgi:hypothetical protein
MRLYFRLALLVLCALLLPAQAPGPVYAYYYAYGPFAVIDERTVALIGSTDLRSPAAFRAMMRDHPHVALLLFVNCPGTRDDASNLALGRQIRAAGLDAYVPPGASVRSGAVELLVAARHRQIADGSQFVVHAWRYFDGREASDFAASSPLHRQYLVYYREMGMTARQAAAFYAMTNSAPHRSARQLSAAEMRAWIAPDIGSPQVAYRPPM